MPSATAQEAPCCEAEMTEEFFLPPASLASNALSLPCLGALKKRSQREESRERDKKIRKGGGGGGASLRLR